MNYLKSITFILGTSLLISCGKDIPKEKTINVNNVAISGIAKKHIAVVDGSYTIKWVEEEKVIIPIKLKLVKSINIKKPKMGNITLVPLDKSGVAIPLGNYNNFSPDTMSDWGKVKDLLRGEVGETVTVIFECGGIFLKEEHIEKIMTETESFEITRTEISSDADDNEPVSQSSSNSEKKTSKNNGNWDKLLDDYDSYVDKYVKLYKKAMAGDNSALSEYPSLMQKAEKLQTSLAKAQSDNSLTASQAGRMMKIQNKMLNALKQSNKKTTYNKV